MTNAPGDEEQPDQPGAQPPPPPTPGPPGHGYGAPPPPPQYGAPPPPPYGAPPPPPYGAPAPYPYYAPPPDHPRATLAMVLGILALVCCQLTGPFAWVIGAKAVREIDASGGRLGGRGQAMAGKVLGIIGTVLLILAVVYLVVIFALLIGGSFSNNGTFEPTGV